jgi:hypothetical protein
MLRPGPVAAVHEQWTSTILPSLVRGGGDRGAGAASTAGGGAGVRHVQVVHVRADPLDVWLALTDPDVTALLLPSTRVGREEDGLRVMSSWIAGGGIQFTGGDGTVEVRGELLECEVSRLLSFTWESVAAADWRTASEAGLGPVRQGVGMTRWGAFAECGDDSSWSRCGGCAG